MLLVQGIEIFDKNIKICTFQLFRKKENFAIIGVLVFCNFLLHENCPYNSFGHACVCITYILDVTILKFKKINIAIKKGIKNLQILA